jgi:nucleotide-binding universal stress UspA family protein
MYTRMLIPLDGSKTAEKVLPYARYFAGRLKLPVELLAVIDMAEMATHIPAEKARFFDSMIEEGVKKSASYLRGVAGTFGDADVKCTVEKGRADEVIIEKGETDTSMVICMATHGRSGLDRFLLGSVAEKVLRGAANPLLLVRATEEAKSDGAAALKSIVVPLDGSELAESIIPMVADMAKKSGLEVVLFRAYHLPTYTYAGDETFSAVDYYDELIAGVRDEATQYLEKKAAEVRKLGVEKVSFVTKEGFAADEIIALGRKNPDSLIAMCSHGRTGVKRWVLGSVTENVVRHSGDPVLVMRAK